MPRNPDWTRDEIILALELYFNLYPNIRRKAQSILDLSKVLRALPIHAYPPDPERFRSPESVHSKLNNFLRYDRRYPGEGAPHGSILDGEVFREFEGDLRGLRILAADIRTRVTNEEMDSTLDYNIDCDESVHEGRIRFRQHRYRERSRVLVEKRKQQALHDEGVLRCVVCGMSFSEIYGEIGEGFIECHHTRPIAQMRPDEETRVQDLALVCANCHRMLHRHVDFMTVDDLRLIIESQRTRQ